jgi:hypothetical protein
VEGMHMVVMTSSSSFRCPSSSFAVTRTVVVDELTNAPTRAPTHRPTLIDIHSKVALEQRLVRMQEQIEKMEEDRTSSSSLAGGVLTTRANDGAQKRKRMCDPGWHCGSAGCYAKASDGNDCRECAHGYTGTLQWKDDAQISYYSCERAATSSPTTRPTTITTPPTAVPTAPHPTRTAVGHLKLQLCVHYKIKPCAKLGLSYEQLVPVLECLSRQVLVGGHKSCLTISTKAAIAHALTAQAWAQPPG